VLTEPHVTSSLWEESVVSWDDEAALRDCRVPVLYIDAGTPKGSRPWDFGSVPGLRVGGEDRERFGVQRDNRTEVALVKAEDPSGLVPVGKDHERAVGEPQPKIGVARFQFDHGGVVIAVKSGYDEPPRREVAEKRASGLMTEALAEEIVDLGRGGSRDDQGAGFAREDVEDRGPLGLRGVGHRDQRSGVDDQRQVPKPASRSGSGICEIGRASPSMRTNPLARAKSRSRDGAG